MLNAREGRCFPALPLARLIVMACVAGSCAKIEEPPGAAPDATPPRLISASPESLAVLPGFKGDVVFRFDEVISEGGSPSSGSGTSELERLVVLSPTTRPPVVRWHRDHITVRPREGWLPDRVYRVELLSGVADLRANRETGGGAVVTFTTGVPLPTLTLTGSVYDWAAGRSAPGATVEAVHAGDSLVYRGSADSSGTFRLGPLPGGAYVVYASIDQNRNRQRDPREAFDSLAVPAGNAEVGRLWTFQHDTAGPRIQSIAVGDSASAAVTFTLPIDPYQRLAPADVRVRLLPDSTPVTVISVLDQARDDSIHRRPAAAERDTTTRPPAGQPPSGQLPAGQPPAGQRPANAPTAGKAPIDVTPQPEGNALLRDKAPQQAKTPPQRTDSTARKAAPPTSGRPAPADTVPTRPPLYTRLVFRIAAAWKPGGRYTVEVRGIRNPEGVAANPRGGLIVPDASRPAAPRDSSALVPRRDTLPASAPSDTVTRRPPTR
ncbi:MAG: Ig-like domain-containing protein [Gemmatimonadales bacterium]|nr:Ig-like domain-containing protein [Gemmatimonadales bacterium]